ncbi:hypothetical protein AVEN_117889-1 [Araneus ventricosus]|uniref:Uncharacterized protein n=1 Tax=Araneus ventricosus TaxID=182803 RepID=A0A4Y2WV29_ARAVE|nr:hypothetical protein AVEN_117655-1 [Araneus ventricosus]GBO40474.1 hypothetical protein AVEN_117889-1 [Araneus ventricosus]
MPSVSLHPLTESERTLSSTLNMALSLPTSIGCSSMTMIKCRCGATGTALQFATECALPVSCHMRKPASNFEILELLKLLSITSSAGSKFIGQ